MRTRAWCQGLENHDSCTSQIEIFWSLQSSVLCPDCMLHRHVQSPCLCTSGSLRLKPAVGLGQRICLQGGLEARPVLPRCCVPCAPTLWPVLCLRLLFAMLPVRLGCCSAWFHLACSSVHFHLRENCSCSSSLGIILTFCYCDCCFCSVACFCWTKPADIFDICTGVLTNLFLFLLFLRGDSVSILHLGVFWQVLWVFWWGFVGFVLFLIVWRRAATGKWGFLLCCWREELLVQLPARCGGLLCPKRRRTAFQGNCACLWMSRKKSWKEFSL